MWSSEKSLTIWPKAHLVRVRVRVRVRGSVRGNVRVRVRVRVRPKAHLTG